MRRPRLSYLVLLAAICVTADCASPLAALALFGTSHRVSIAATGSLVLHHEMSADGRLDSGAAHTHALADLLMIARAGTDGAPDGDHTITPSSSDQLTSRPLSETSSGRFDTVVAVVNAPAPVDGGRYRASPAYAGLAPPLLLRTTVLRI